MQAASHKYKELPKIVLMVAFLGLLALPTLDTFFGLDRAPAPNEKRELAKFPTFEPSAPGVKKFFVGLETYYNDHFGFRNRLIRWNNRWKKNWFKDTSFADVINGKEGWYFFTGGRMIEHYRGTLLFSQDDLLAWENLLEGRRDWLAQRGIKYLFVVPPNKQSVYSEYLPDWLKRVGSTTKLDQFVQHMKANTTLEIVDLRQPLIDGKDKGRLFMYTDSHWNMLGGFVAYQTVVKHLQVMFPDIQPLALEQFEQRFEDRPGGDLAAMLGQEATMIEKDDITLVPKAGVPSFETHSLTNMFNKKWARFAEPVLTKNPNATRKAIIFRDSFTGCLLPFLGCHFKESYFIWQYNWTKDFIEKQKPDVVMDIMLEGYLNRTDPRELKELDESPDTTMASHNH